MNEWALSPISDIIIFESNIIIFESKCFNWESVSGGMEKEDCEGGNGSIFIFKTIELVSSHRGSVDNDSD